MLQTQVAERKLVLMQTVMIVYCIVPKLICLADRAKCNSCSQCAFQLFIYLRELKLKRIGLGSLQQSCKLQIDYISVSRLGMLPPSPRLSLFDCHL